MTLKMRNILYACAILFLVSIQESDAGIPPEIAKLLPRELLDLIASLRGACSKKVGLTPDDIETFKMIPNVPQPYRCYMSCMLTTVGWITPKGKLMYDKMISDTHSDVRDMFATVVNQCRDTPVGDGSDNCEISYLFNVCMAKVDPDRYFLP